MALRAVMDGASRAGTGCATQAIRVAGYEHRLAERRVAIAGRQPELTATEYGVLYELSAHAGMVLTHHQMLLRVWGINHSGDHGLVLNILTRLRRKLGDRARQPRYILTEPRVGYRMPKGKAVEENPGNHA